MHDVKRENKMSDSRYYYYRTLQKAKIGDKVVRAHDFWSDHFNDKERVFTVKHVNSTERVILFKEIKFGWEVSKFKPVEKTEIDTEYKELFI